MSSMVGGVYEILPTWSEMVQFSHHRDSDFRNSNSLKWTRVGLNTSRTSGKILVTHVL